MRPKSCLSGIVPNGKNNCSMKLFLHIGLHKTGTTFTQREIFQKITNKNIHYYGPDDGIENLKQFNKHVLNVLKKNKTKKNKKIIVSHEGLLQRRKNDFEFEKNIKEIKKNFKKFKPTIILSLRYQPEWIVSIYKDCLRHGYFIMNFEKFIKSKKNLNLKKIDYVKLIELLRKNLGKNNINLIFYEDLKENKKYLINEYSKILRKKINYKNINFQNKHTVNISNLGARIILTYYNFFKYNKKEYLKKNKLYKVRLSHINLLKNPDLYFKVFVFKILYRLINFNFLILVRDNLDFLLKKIDITDNFKLSKNLIEIFTKQNIELKKLIKSTPKKYYKI